MKILKLSMTLLLALLLINGLAVAQDDSKVTTKAKECSVEKCADKAKDCCGICDKKGDCTKKAKACCGTCTTKSECKAKAGCKDAKAGCTDKAACDKKVKAGGSKEKAEVSKPVSIKKPVATKKVKI